MKNQEKDLKNENSDNTERRAEIRRVYENGGRRT